MRQPGHFDFHLAATRSYPRQSPMVISANSPTGIDSSTITEPSISGASHWVRAMSGCLTGVSLFSLRQSEGLFQDLPFGRGEVEQDAHILTSGDHELDACL